MARETELRCDTPQLCFSGGMGVVNTFSHRAMWVWIFFFFHKKNPSFKNCMLCLLVLSLINI